ncbi:MAG: GMC oxidoreductase [Bryobacteraceae bacterium]
MPFEQTSFTVDLIGRFVCNTWDEAINSGGAPFDVVVIGAGMHGGYCAEKIYRFAKEAGKNPRILVLDAGSLLLTQHEQNYPNINPNVGPFNVVTSNVNDPGPQEAVWGYPWRSNQSFPGLAFCIGGRSLYWGGWAPKLTPDDLNNWPVDVKAHLLPNYPRVEQEIGITAALHEPLSAALIARFNAAAGAGITVEPAPLAVQSTAPAGVLFSFDKYSSANLLIDAVREDAVRDPTPANRQLLLVPHVNVTRLLNDGTKVTGIEVQANGRMQRISTSRELKPTVKVVIASSTIESTRLALNSFPVNGMGANLMAHLRSNTTVTIPRAELGLGPPTQLETGMLLVRGDVPVSGGKTHHFHLQVIAASNLASVPDSQVFTQIPDVDLLNDLITAQSPDTIVMVLRAVGELSGDQTMTPPEGPKDVTKSWVDLTKDANNLEFGTTRRAWVNLVTNTDDDNVKTAMNKAAIDLAKGIANDPTKVVIKSQVIDPIGSTHHEAGTLWTGAPATSITDKDGRFHHINNAYVAGPALFPRIGSANPSLTAMALARNTASVIVNLL